MDNQVDNLYLEIKKTIIKKERVLVTTLTKRMSEDLAEYYSSLGLKVKYMHSDIPTLERIEIINNLRHGDFDVLIGINLLREGLDIPEVSLVAIMDADKRGFLRSTRSLIQTIGRASRNVKGRVILYANEVTDSMKQAILETERRREIQKIYNKKNNITPQTIVKEISGLRSVNNSFIDKTEEFREYKSVQDIDNAISKYEFMISDLVQKTNFEEAGKIRDKISALKIYRLELG